MQVTNGKMKSAVDKISIEQVRQKEESRMTLDLYAG